MRFLLVCLLMLTPLAALAQDENSDRGFIQGILEDALSAPGRSVRLEGFSGALSTRATIDRIVITDPDGVWLTANDVALDWNRSALLRGRVEIEEISVGLLDFPRLPLPAGTEVPTPEASGTAFALPELPVSVEINEMRIDRAVIGAAVFGEAAEISFTGSANLAGGAGAAQLAIQRLDKDGEFTVTGAYDNASQELALDLRLQEPEDGIAVNLLDIPDRPSLVLSVTGDDPIGDFQAAIEMSTDGEERLSGTVTLLSGEEGASRFAADLSGDIAPVFIPEFAEFLGDQVELVAEGGRDPDGALSLDQLRLRAAALELTGEAYIAADGWPEKLDLKATVTPPNGERVILPLPGGQTSVEGVTLEATFDAATGDNWQVVGIANGFDQPGLKVETVNFSGSGEVSRETRGVTGRLELVAAEIAPADAAYANAVGPRLQGALDFEWSQDAPLRLREIDVAGEDYGLTGMVSVAGLTGDATINVVPELQLEAQDLSRFADLAGLLGLAGAADLAVSGNIEPLTGVFALALDGTTLDLATGIAQADPLLEGEGTLNIQITRDESGTNIAPLLVRTDHARIEGTAALATGASIVDIDARVPDLSRALPGLVGPADITIDATQDGETWDVTAQAALPGQTAASYRGTVLQTAAETRDEPGSLLLDGRLEARVGQLEAWSQVAGRDLSGAAEFTAEGTADLLALTFDLTAEGRTQDPLFGIPQAEALLQGDTRLVFDGARNEDGAITLRRVAIDGQEVQAEASGVIAQDSGTLDYMVALDDVGLVLDTLTGPATLTGRAQRDGDTWTVDTEADLPGGTGASFDGTITGDGQDVLIVDGRLQADIARLSAFSSFAGRDLGGAVSLTAQGRVDVLNLTFDIDTQGSITDPRFGIPAVEPLLRGTTSFDIDAARAADGSVTIRTAVIDGQVLDATLTGGFGPETGSLTYDVSLTDVGTVLDGLRGPASLTGRADRNGDTWTVDTTADLPGGTGATYQGTVTGDGTTQLVADGLLQAQVNDLSAFSSLAGRPLGGAFDVTAQGQVDLLNITFDLQANGSVTSPVFGVPVIEPLLRGTGSFNANAARDAGGDITIRTAVFDGPNLDATISGSTGPGGNDLTFDIAIPDIGVLVPDFPGPARVTGTATQQGDSYQINASGTGPGGIQLTARGRVAADGSRLDISTSGVVPLALANRQLQGQALTGLVRFDLAVNGPPALSSVSGRLSLAEARLALPAQGITLENVSGGADLAGNTARLDVSASVSSGGRLQITGPVSLDAPYSANLAIDLRDVILRDASLYEARLAGRVTVTGPLTGGAVIGGAVNLIEAELRIPNIGPSYSALDGLTHFRPPADVRRTLRFAGLEADPSASTGGGTGPAYPLDLTVNAPNRIFVRGRGLDAELGGRLRLTGTTRDIVPIGSFSLIRGRLDLLGRRLTLTQGDVQLRGSFNPVIFFEATTEVEDVLITLRLEGEASSPELTVTSSPELPQDEALSLFLFGRDVTSISALQAVQLAAAIRTLSGQGGLGLTGTLREGLGVDDLDIGTDAEGNAEARVGTYISDNVYTDVTVNSEGESEINLNLDLIDNVTVRGSVASDGETGIGIFYERDY